MPCSGLLEEDRENHISSHFLWIQRNRKLTRKAEVVWGCTPTASARSIPTAAEPARRGESSSPAEEQRRGRRGPLVGRGEGCRGGRRREGRVPLPAVRLS